MATAPGTPTQRETLGVLSKVLHLAREKYGALTLSLFYFDAFQIKQLCFI